MYLAAGFLPNRSNGALASIAAAPAKLRTRLTHSLRSAPSCSIRAGKSPAKDQKLARKTRFRRCSRDFGWCHPTGCLHGLPIDSPTRAKIKRRHYPTGDCARRLAAEEWRRAIMNRKPEIGEVA